MQTNLGKVITEIQRDAAGTSTPDLRADIEVGLEVLDAAITDLHALHPGADVMERAEHRRDRVPPALVGPARGPARGVPLAAGRRP